MGRKCEICNRRKAKHIINIHIAAGKEKVFELCWACQKRYIKLREKYLAIAFNELVAPYIGEL